MQNSSGDLILYGGGTLASNTGGERLRLPASGGIKFPDGTTQTTAMSSGNVSPTFMSPGTFGGSGTYNFPANVTAAGSIKANSHLSFMPWVNVAGTNATGYMRLLTPIVSNESNMFSLHLYGYRYNGDVQAIDIRCGGYAYNPTGLTNTACTATGTDLPVQITTEPVNSVNQVVVRIGKLDTSWYYPHFSLEYDGWQAKDPAAFSWSIVGAVPAGAPALANMNNVAVSNANGGSLAVGQTANDTTTRMTVNGAVQINGKLTATQVVGAVYQDVAEWVPATGKLPAGTVVVLNLDKNNEVQASDHAYDTAVAGVVSEMPGLILGVESPSKAQIATTGRVHVKVDATRHPIKVGDLLVTSDRSGVAMKSIPIEVGGVQDAPPRNDHRQSAATSRRRRGGDSRPAQPSVIRDATRPGVTHEQDKKHDARRTDRDARADRTIRRRRAGDSFRHERGPRHRCRTRRTGGLHVHRSHSTQHDRRKHGRRRYRQ
jgi:hypothetical protein